jgi:hypothetical protein
MVFQTIVLCCFECIALTLSRPLFFLVQPTPTQAPLLLPSALLKSVVRTTVGKLCDSCCVSRRVQGCRICSAARVDPEKRSRYHVAFSCVKLTLCLSLFLSLFSFSVAREPSGSPRSRRACLLLEALASWAAIWLAVTSNHAVNLTVALPVPSTTQLSNAVYQLPTTSVSTNETRCVSF